MYHSFGQGGSRSATVAETLEVAREVAKTGVREVVLTGVNIGDFGVQQGETLMDLIRELDHIPGIDRFRISSIEPNLLSDEIIQFVSASQKFVPHFHVPLQSGSDKLLKMMRRKYERSLYEEKVQKIKEVMPDAAIGVDVIVGFPGETEEDFLETYEFLVNLDVSYLHVFPYSERARTTAKKLEDKVPQQIKNERVSRLRILSEKKRQAFYRIHLGKTYSVLFEAEEDKGKMSGFTQNYIKVETDYDPLLVNELISAELQQITPNGNVSAAIQQMVH